MFGLSDPVPTKAAPASRARPAAAWAAAHRRPPSLSMSTVGRCTAANP